MNLESCFSSYGYIRTAAVVPALHVADPDYNVQKITEVINFLSAQGASIILFPELCITGYTCGDLFYEAILLKKALDNLQKICDSTKKEKVTVIVGLPLLVNNRLHNCAAIISQGNLCGIVAKKFIPSTNEYYENRWFTSGLFLSEESVPIMDKLVPIGTDLIFYDPSFPGLSIGIEICEDLWAVKPPSGDLALAGATLLFNPSASNETVGKAKYRRELVKHQSARCIAGYIYSSSGPDESSTDLVFSGHALIAENGQIISESERFLFDTRWIMADLDIQKLVHDRMKNCSFSANVSKSLSRKIIFQAKGRRLNTDLGLLCSFSRSPFIPANKNVRDECCQEIFNLQAIGLAKRLRHIGTSNVVIGLSGGLDSTLSLLVAIRAFDIIQTKFTGIIVVIMPGFGSTSRTFTNAKKLSSLFGVTVHIIDIKDSVNHHFLDIGHDDTVHDITYENAQARERTQILMDIANQVNGIVIGTGDLSELALGWCTYNGDHMSMYNVNAGVPKTLVRNIVQWYADFYYQKEISEVLTDIINTPISPELLPPSIENTITQVTEEKIGSFELHDFFLFYMIRYHFPPKKIYFLACFTFKDQFSKSEISNTLKTFYKRFFSNQFKRSSMPDGPKIGSVSLSPRGDWRMPSDAEYTLWIKEIEELHEPA